ncbi:MAG: PstS family phosphate ABC transporter substrate-binding protein [Caulobacterales bacterium]
MKSTFKQLGKAAAIAVSALALVGFSSTASAQAGRGVFTVVIDGSSTVFPISEAAASGFQTQMGGRVRVTVGESGTGGGFRKFCRGETHIQDASRPITASEMTACANTGVNYIEVPIAFDALSVVVNPSNPLKEITVADLKKIWQPEAQGRITNWKQVGAGYPDLPLTLYGPGTASGTFDYFTEAVNGKAKASRTDYTPSEDDNILVQGVAGEAGAMGYFGMAYYEQNKDKVRALAVNSGKGGVYPSVEAVKAGKYVPLARPIFIYVNVAAMKQKPVADFVNHYLTNAMTYVTKTGYVPLPPAAYQTYASRVAKREAGTAFGGKADIGSSIEEVMSRKLVKTVQ